MKMTRRSVVLGGLGLLASTTMARYVFAETGTLFDPGEDPEDLGLAAEAYIFGYPLVTMELTRRIITNVAVPAGTRGPMGQIIKMRNYPDASFRDVTAPNADTLYTNAFFDVGSEPWVLSIPDMKDRYFLMPMLDGWTTVFQVPGKRTTGTGAQTYAITDLTQHSAGAHLSPAEQFYLLAAKESNSATFADSALLMRQNRRKYRQHNFF